MGPHFMPLSLLLRQKYCSAGCLRLISCAPCRPIIGKYATSVKSSGTSCFSLSSRLGNPGFQCQPDDERNHFGKCSFSSSSHRMRDNCATTCLQSRPVRTCNQMSGHLRRQRTGPLASASYSSMSSAFPASRGSLPLFLHAVPEPPLCLQQVRHSSTEPTTLYEGLLDSQPVHFAESAFQFVHTTTGLPWWASIIATTITLRFALTLPLAVYSQNIRARVEAQQPEVIALSKRAFVQRFAARAKSEQWSEKRAQRAFVGLVKRYSKELYVRDNCHPAKGSILFLVQLPMWVFLSLSLRNMTGAFSETMYVNPSSIIPELATGGALWIPSLVAPDPLLILPFLVGGLNLANIEMHALHKGRVTKLQRYLNNFLRTISVVMIPIAAYVPSAMSLYWTASACYGLGQNILLKVPTARRALGIRPSKTDSETPFRDMGDEFLLRYVGPGKGQLEVKEEVMEELQDGDVKGGQKEDAQKKSQS